MPSLLRTTQNTRAILPDSLRLIRSDAPVSVSEQDLQWLLDHQITTVIDLRERWERDRRPCPLERHPFFRYLNMPVTGGNRVPESPELVPQSYLQMVDGQMERVLHTILRAETNVLYFCTAGKDRTGVVSALLLRHFGYDDEYIIADYLQSAENLRDMFLDYTRRCPHVDLNVITPRRAYMEAFLKQISDLRIEKAVEADIDILEQLYDDLNDHLAAHVNYPGWQKGWYPVRGCAEAGLADGTLYVARRGYRVAGTMILDQNRDPAYDQASWTVEESVLVVHTFAIHPDFLGQGIGRQMMNYAIGHGKSLGLAAIHLDTYERNIPAKGLYESLGFRFRGKVDLGYGAYGREWYDAYELPL